METLPPMSQAAPALRRAPAARLSGRLSLSAALLLSLLGGAAWAEQQPRSSVPAVTEAQREALQVVREDAEPEKLNATRKDLEDRHYLTGDEINLDKFYPHLKDLGGAYAGVGSDQAYLFIGWMRPEFAWVTDYDPWISDLHLSYHAFFEKAENIEDFRAYWAPKNHKSSYALLAETYADHPRKKNILHVFNRAHYMVSARLRKLGKAMESRGVPSFVSDEAMYADVRARVRAGRVRALQCNLIAASGCMRSLGEASKKLGVPLRALYVSNAEQYWPYRAAYRENIAAQNFDERSYFVRTIAMKPVNGDYHYNLQPGLNFQQWLAEDWVRSYRQLLPAVRLAEKTDIPFSIQQEDPASKRPQPPQKKTKKK